MSRRPRAPRATRAVLVGTVLLGLLVAGLGVLALRMGSRDAPALTLSSEAGRSTPPPRVVSAGETYVRTVVLASGDVEVTQWIESTLLLFRVELAVPAPSGTTGVGVEDVHVVADGMEATTTSDGPRRVYMFPGSGSVEIRYRLTRAVEPSPSTPGRGLVRPTALDVSYEPASGLVTRTVVAPEVLSLACAPPEPRAEAAPCGASDDATAWTVNLTGGRTDDRVLAQVTLE